MAEDIIIPDFGEHNTNRYIKTYSKTDKNTLSAKDTDRLINSLINPVEKREPLTTKNAMKYLLEGSLKEKVCRYCLNVPSELSELDQILQFAGQGTLYKVTIRDMVASFHPIKVADDNQYPNKICNKCLDRTISSYLFTQQCEQAERALRNCFEDMYEKIDKLDPLERPKKRGRHKLNPNYNILYTDHEKVINYAEPLINIIHTATESLVVEGHIKEFECPKCCQVLPDVESLLNHEKSHPKSMWYHCRLCGKSFPKRYQWKKHSNIHLVDKPVKPTNNGFTCNHCGEVSKDSNEYLRHIEKHKFKVVMEHLVEKKMDDLCSVCLDKSSNMSELDQMVCLHGGHMDMAGERSLYSVLASTIPDPKMYKYQELMIPHYATIFKIVKKNKNAAIMQIMKPTYNLSQPIILSMGDINSEDVYTFFFSLPLTEESVKEIENPKEDTEMSEFLIKPSALEDYNMDKDNIDNAKAIKPKEADLATKEDKIIYTFSKPLHADDIFEDNIKVVEEIPNTQIEDNIIDEGKPKTCKTCWIFNDKLCDECKEQKQDVLSKFEIDGKAKLCSYCWLFKHVANCEYCKKPNKISVIEDSNADAAKITSRDTDCKEINKEDDKPWQCAICLTINNAANETCCCCDLIKLNDPLKVKFGHYPSTFITTDASQPNEVEENNNTIECVKHVELPSETVANASNDVSPLAAVQDMDVEPLTNITSIDNQGLSDYQHIAYSSNIIHSGIEEMDVEENTGQNTTQHSIYPMKEELKQVTPFQFNIGSASTESQTRKFKRAVRKWGRATHK